MRSGSRLVPVLVVILLGGCGGDGSDAGEQAVGDGRGGIQLEPIGKFDRPVHLTQPPSGRDDLFVVEQTGRILRVPAEGGNPEPYLDIRDRTKVGGEAGLLSLAFSPDFESSGRFYVDYIDESGDTRVVEFQGTATEADPRSDRELVFVDQPDDQHNNGGLVLFGPDDQLYIGLGDGGLEGDPYRNGQDLRKPLGKILRIDPAAADDARYSIPEDNPFLDESGSGNPSLVPGRRAGGREPLGEILAYGLRNPWRFSFDRHTGDLWIGDVGELDFEEVNAVRGDGAGANFGWSAYEGYKRFNRDERTPDATAPLHVTLHTQFNCALIGGYVVRDPALESLYGRYLYGDTCNPELRSFSAERALDAGEAEDDRSLGVEVQGLSSFGEDASGHIYAVSLAGDVFRLVPAAE